MNEDWEESYSITDVIEILEELLDTDGFMRVLVIYDTPLADDLEASGYAFKTTKGAYRGTEQTREALRFCKDLYKILTGGHSWD